MQPSAGTTPPAAPGAAAEPPSPGRLAAFVAPRLVVRDTGGAAIANASLHVAAPDAPYLPDMAAAAHSDPDGTIPLASDQVGQSVLIAAEGFATAIVTVRGGEEPQIVVLEPEGRVEFSCMLGRTPVPNCQLMMSRVPISPLAQRAAIRQGIADDAPLVGDVRRDDAVWRATTDAAGRCSIRGFRPGQYYVACFHDDLWPVDPDFLGNHSSRPFAASGTLVVELAEMFAAVVCLSGDSPARDVAARVDPARLSLTAGALARARHVDEALHARFPSALVRVGAPANPGDEDAMLVDWFVTAQDGSAWRGRVPMVPVRSIEHPSYLEREAIGAGAVTLRASIAGKRPYPDRLSLVAADGAPRPPARGRDGERLLLPEGRYTWDLGYSNPWLEDRCKPDTVELKAGAELEWRITLPECVSIRLEPRIEPNPLLKGAHVRLESGGSSYTWVWRPDHGAIDVAVLPADAVLVATAMGCKPARLEIAAMQMVDGARFPIVLEPE